MAKKVKGKSVYHTVLMNTEQKTLKDYSVVELKALGYDQISVYEVAQYNLKAINDELKARNQPAVSKEDTVEVPEEVEVVPTESTETE